MTQLTTTKADNSGIVDYRYTFDAAGQLKTESHHGNTATYGYDFAGQLISTANSSPALAAENFAYDANGNRSTSTTIGTNNQTLADDRFNYSYDAEGNLIRKLERATGEITSYTYDYHNRLIEVDRTSAGGILLNQAKYTYDVFDKLIIREANGVKLATVYFLKEEMRQIREQPGRKAAGASSTTGCAASTPRGSKSSSSSPPRWPCTAPAS